MRELVANRVTAAGHDPTARLFTGPARQDHHRGARRRDPLRQGGDHAADTGVPVHVLPKIAGHGSLSQCSTTEVTVTNFDEQLIDESNVRELDGSADGLVRRNRVRFKGALGEDPASAHSGQRRVRLRRLALRAGPFVW